MCIKPSPCSPLLSAKSSFSSWEEHQPLHLQSHQVSKGHTDVEVRALPQSTSVYFLIFTNLLLPWLSPGPEGGAGREQAGQASWSSPLCYLSSLTFQTRPVPPLLFCSSHSGATSSLDHGQEMQFVYQVSQDFPPSPSGSTSGGTEKVDVTDCESSAWASLVFLHLVSQLLPFLYLYHLSCLLGNQW